MANPTQESGSRKAFRFVSGVVCGSAGAFVGFKIGQTIGYYGDLAKHPALNYAISSAHAHFVSIEWGLGVAGVAGAIGAVVGTTLVKSRKASTSNQLPSPDSGPGDYVRPEPGSQLHNPNRAEL